MSKIKYTNGGLATYSPPEDNKHKYLLKDFIVLDKRGVEWKAPEDMKTDGKSVPDFLEPIIGDPFEGVTMEAAVIHDRYCVKKVRSQKDTHRIFREIVLHEMEHTYKWFTILPWKNKAWQYQRAWLMWLGVRAFNRIKHPDWK